MNKNDTQTFISNTLTDIINHTKIIDIHTHLFPPQLKELSLFGVDNLLTYHYLIAELFRVVNLKPAEFWKLKKPKQADLVWNELFLKRSPISESARGFLTVLQKLEIKPTRDLNKIRKIFSRKIDDNYCEKILKLASVKKIIMTNDSLDPVEYKYYSKGPLVNKNFSSSLRLDKLLEWDKSFELIREMNYKVRKKIDGDTIREIKRILENWIEKIRPLYMAISLSPAYKYSDNSDANRIFRNCIIPIAQDHDMPIALMIGVRRNVNPQIKKAGDSLGKFDITNLEQLCLNHPQNKFLVTALSRENQHELCVTARKFSNFMLFGSWWFLNNPGLIREILEMRIEMLGFSFIPQHSDSRVLEQLLYKWEHFRQILIDVLTKHYIRLINTGWKIKKEEMQRDVDLLLWKNFLDFLKRKV